MPPFIGHGQGMVLVENYDMKIWFLLFFKHHHHLQPLVEFECGFVNQGYNKIIV
jgi:hypothetical protein